LVGPFSTRSVLGPGVTMSKSSWTKMSPMVFVLAWLAFAATSERVIPWPSNF
jgi:hypothetical protein